MSFLVLLLISSTFINEIPGYYIRHAPYKADISETDSPIIIPYPNTRIVQNRRVNPIKDIMVNRNVPAILIETSQDIEDDAGFEDHSANDLSLGDDYRIIEESKLDDSFDGNTILKTDDTLDYSDIPIGTPESEKEVPGEPLTPEDFENAKKLEILVPPLDEDSPDPILTAGLFEGDIAGVNLSDITYFEKNAIRDLNKRWPGGIIPYVISSSFNLYERSVIAAAVQDFHAYTCIRFVPRTTQRDYVHLLKGSGCSSMVGLFGGGQQVSLGAGCVYKGIVEHELMHACGFWHEQSRGDRDDYLTILWQNIVPGQEHNFQKFSWRISQSLGVSYDTGSVMHYGRYAFTRNFRLPTIIPRNPNAQIGQRRGFSEIDLLKINRLYECRGSIPMPTIPPVTVPKPIQCANNNRFCQYWANAGECRRNPAWMNVNCAKSCGVCESKCGNYNRNCENWATLGQCTRNPDYMTIYCPQACHSCYEATDESIGCKDQNRYCAAWAENGQCRANPNYMLIFCKQSCNQCQ